jgi:hypothetical protein
LIAFATRPTVTAMLDGKKTTHLSTTIQPFDPLAFYKGCNIGQKKSAYLSLLTNAYIQRVKCNGLILQHLQIYSATSQDHEEKAYRLNPLIIHEVLLLIKILLGQ